MGILCRMFGHREEPYSGRTNDAAYGSASLYTIDNLGTEHWEVFGECSRCRQTFRMARFHGPLKTPPHIAAIGEARRAEGKT